MNAMQTELKKNIIPQLGGDALVSKMLLDELVGSLDEVFGKYAGVKLDDEVIKDMCQNIYASVSKSGLKPSLAAYDTHIDLHIEHPNGPNYFSADISLDLRSDDANYTKTDTKAN